MGAKNINEVLHIVSVLGKLHRDQIIMTLDKAIDLVKVLDDELLKDENVVFFDPFCKAGEVLLATALISLQKKIKNKFITLNSLHKELYESNRFFGLSLDDRHYRMSMRTFYGNEGYEEKKYTEKKFKKLNIWKGSYLEEDTGKFKVEIFKKEAEDMLEYIKSRTKGKKIITIGNPPYQEKDGGYGNSAKPVYPVLIESLIDSNKIDELLVVIPSRWFSGGKYIDDFREKMISSNNVKYLRYFEKSNDIFSSVDIRGGVCFLNWSKAFKGKTLLDEGKKKVRTKFSFYDIIVPHIESHSILDKVINKSNKFLSEIVWARKPFGLETSYFNKNETTFTGKKLITCMYRNNGFKKIPRNLIQKNQDKIDDYKVAFPKASGGGKNSRHKTLPLKKYFFILKPKQISTETYSIAGSFKNLKAAENYQFYLRTDFAMFLLGIRKRTQDSPRKVFKFIPYMGVDKKWTDEMLFKYFRITKKEQEYIREKVKEWTP